ncbi:MAG: aspartyl protease family protein [Bacteroidetes bacterium]|nr:aspartyl protease family protein [Bacteroidota bacterium]
MRRFIFFLMIYANIAIAQNELALLPAFNSLSSDASEKDFSKTFTSFELINGLPVVQAEVNGKVGNFIIDTGAPGIVINAKSTESNSNNHKGGSIGGNIELSEIIINAFAWENIQLENITGLALDISHLEKAADKKIAGLIGFEILKKFELFFDFQSKTIRIYSSKKSELHKNNKPTESIPFEMQGHIPVILVKIENQTFRMGIDTGAETNLIDKQLLKKLNKDNLLNPRVEELRGLDRQIQRQIATEIKNTQTKKNNFHNMKYLTSDFSKINETYGLELDGLLGAPFLNSAKISINYQKRKIYIW